MTAATKTYDPGVARQQYENLRANALGEITRALNLTLFLRDGMSAWLRTLGEHGDANCTIRREPLSVLDSEDADMPGAELASILTDAILNTAGPVGHFGGNR